LIVETLEFARNPARDNKKTKISSWHIMLTIRNDKELNFFLSSIKFASTCVIHHIHKIHHGSKKRESKEQSQE
jgi:hypothetical protein